jgi:hypothetical protein
MEKTETKSRYDKPAIVAGRRQYIGYADCPAWHYDKQRLRFTRPEASKDKSRKLEWPETNATENGEHWNAWRLWHAPGEKRYEEIDIRYVITV